MSDTLGSQITCSINGVSVIVQTDATADNFNMNYTPLTRSTGTDNSLVGYYPGLADGSFTLATDLYPEVLDALMADSGISSGTIVDGAVVPVVLGFGGSGGIGLDAKVKGATISTAIGQVPSLRLELEAVGPPDEVAAPAAPTLGLPYVALDVNPSHLLATAASMDVTGWTITMVKTMAKKRAFNHSNWPSAVKQSRVEVTVSYTLYNVSPAERAAWLASMAGCPTVSDITLGLTQQCSDTPASATWVVKDCFAESHKPGSENGADGFANETFGAKSSTGKMSFAA